MRDSLCSDDNNKLEDNVESIQPLLKQNIYFPQQVKAEEKLNNFNGGICTFNLSSSESLFTNDTLCTTVCTTPASSIDSGLSSLSQSPQDLQKTASPSLYPLSTYPVLGVGMASQVSPKVQGSPGFTKSEGDGMNGPKIPSSFEGLTTPLSEELSSPGTDTISGQATPFKPCSYQVNHNQSPTTHPQRDMRPSVQQENSTVFLPDIKRELTSPRPASHVSSCSSSSPSPFHQQRHHHQQQKQQHGYHSGVRDSPGSFSQSPTYSGVHASRNSPPSWYGQTNTNGPNSFLNYNGRYGDQLPQNSNRTPPYSNGVDFRQHEKNGSFHESFADRLLGDEFIDNIQTSPELEGFHDRRRDSMGSSGPQEWGNRPRKDNTYIHLDNVYDSSGNNVGPHQSRYPNPQYDGKGMGPINQGSAQSFYSPTHGKSYHDLSNSGHHPNRAYRPQPDYTGTYNNHHGDHSDVNQVHTPHNISDSSSPSTSMSPTPTVTPNDKFRTVNNTKGGGGQDKPSKSSKPSRGAQNLPPCRVCGNKASGLHFGVNTCEACNEFFRRSLKRGASYYCTKNRECQVYGKKRNACSYCRYRRCVEMGMSREAIKTGRYSHKTRTEYAMEVEEYKLKEMNKAKDEKYDKLLSDLVKHHDRFVNTSTRVSDEELYRRQSTYLNIFNTHADIGHRHPPLSPESRRKSLMRAPEYQQSAEHVTLTVQDAQMTEKWLRNYINYAKNVPGFKELALSDQASLVRGTWFEFWFLGAYRGYNSDLQVVTYPNGRCFHASEICKVFGQEYTEFSFYLSEKMADLDVTPEEMVLIKTVCLTFPDRSLLEARDEVEKMHWLMVNCLLHTLEKNRPGDNTIFPMIVNKLVHLRTLTEVAMRAHKGAVFQDVLKDSPLLCEMVDTKTQYVDAEGVGKLRSGSTGL